MDYHSKANNNNHCIYISHIAHFIAAARANIHVFVDFVIVYARLYWFDFHFDKFLSYIIYHHYQGN